MGFLEALLLGTVMAGIGTAGTLYANKKNQQLNTQRWGESVELANTAHQREVSDLRAAGLNPILSAGGSGAQVPSMQAATAENPTQGFNDVASTVANAAMTNRLHQGDIAEQKYKKTLFDDPEVRKALKDKMVLDGAPKNAYEAGYLGMSKAGEKGEDGKSFWQKMTDVFESTPNGNNKSDMSKLDAALAPDPEYNKKVSRQDEEREKDFKKNHKYEEGYWEVDEHGARFIPEKWSSSYRNNKNKQRRYKHG